MNFLAPETEIFGTELKNLKHEYASTESVFSHGVPVIVTLLTNFFDRMIRSVLFYC
jgi:hypothetical protein